MKNRVFLQALLLVVVNVSIIACTEQNQDAELAALNARIKQVEKENQDLRNAAGNTGLKNPQPTAEYNDTFLTNFCSLLKPNLTPDELAPYLSTKTNPQALMQRIQDVAQLTSSCKMLGKKLYDHPFDIAEYKLDNGLYLYLQATYDTDFKIMILDPLVVGDPIELSAHKVPTQD